MNETILTVRGYVGSDVHMRAVGEGATLATFRLACTPRRFNRRTGEWADAVTQWFTVNAWRAMADNVAGSVSKGDPVVVHGRLSVSEWVDQTGQERRDHQIDADAIGHDLARGTSVFTKSRRDEPGPAEAPAAPVDPVADWRAPGGDATAA